MVRRILLTVVLIASSSIYVVTSLNAFHNAWHTLASDDCHWNYDPTSSLGPQHWGDMCHKKFPNCALRRQSPIDLGSADLVELALGDPREQQIHLYRNYHAETKTRLLNNGHTVEVLFNNTVPSHYNETAQISKTKLHLSQFHFHSPSEHTFNGQHYPLEMHMFHVTEDDKPHTVLSILFDYPEESVTSRGAQGSTGGHPFLAEIVPSLPRVTQEQQSYILNDIVDPTLVRSVNDETTPYYHYVGSSSAPPCAPDIHWFVLSKVETASRAQIDAFKAVLGDNARPVQPIYNRDIQRIFTRKASASPTASPSSTVVPAIQWWVSIVGGSLVGSLVILGLAVVALRELRRLAAAGNARVVLTTPSINTDTMPIVIVNAE